MIVGQSYEKGIENIWVSLHLNKKVTNDGE